MLGDEYPAFARCFEEEPVRDKGLRVNLLKASPEEFLQKNYFPLKPLPWAKEGFLCPEEARPGKHPCHEAGVYYLQEPSAMVPAALLGAEPGERILDLCAAPGGKTTQTASAMQNRGLLVSNEILPERAKILSQNVERMGIRNAVVTNTDAHALADRLPGYFDRILVDAPCSGEGMFRKEPLAIPEWSMENVKMCAARQKEILDCAAVMLREGGILVYSTCTFSTEEDEGTVGEFLHRHPEFRVAKTPEIPGFSHGRPEWGSGRTEGLEYTVRMWPHIAAGEGHFAAVLRKGEAGIPLTAGRSGARRGGRREAFCDRERYALWEAFCRETFRKPEEWLVPERLVLRKDTLWLLPEEMPELSGVRILRPGLMLGEFLKKRFEPSHALAMALSPEEVLRAESFGADAPETAAYLGGETLRTGTASGEKGWTLICVDGWSLGWAKCAGGALKNHYPRGLRTRC